jgi:transcriptional regulator with XRE-family HTH domain
MFSAKRLLNKIRAFRKDNRITQIAFAKQIGISVSTLVNWERERSDFNPTLTQIINMAKVFGVTPGELLLQGKDKLVAKDNGKDNSKTATKQAQSKTKSSTKAKAATVLEANEKKQSKRTAKSSSVAEVKGKASAAAVAMPDTSTKQERKRGRTRKHV